jgi:hypothetical protein
MNKLLLFLAIWLVLLVPANAATYYVDYTSGSDGNAGTKLSPWQNAPGMQTCSSLCASTTINAGDSIILKGGVTWPNASFMWSFPSSGTSGSPIYIGVDQTWYIGGTWSRPILNAGGTVIGNNYDTMLSMPANVTLDNFEITGFYWTTVACSGASYGDCGILNAGQRTGQTLEHLYVHGWTHAGTDANSSNGVISLFQFGGNGANTAHDNVIVGTDMPGDHSVAVFFNGPAIVYNNYIKQVASAAIISYATLFHDNHLEDIGPTYCNSTGGYVNISGSTATWVSGSTFTTGSSWDGLTFTYWNGTTDVTTTVSSVASTTQLTIVGSATQTNVPYYVFSNAGACAHENGFEDNGDIGLDVYNNVITNVVGGLAFWIAPNPGYSAYMWNNVVYSVNDNQGLDIPAPPIYNASYCTGTQGGRAAAETGNGYCNIGGSLYFWNNTVQCGSNTTQYDNCQTNIGNIQSGGTLGNVVSYLNNHFVTALGSAPTCYTGTGAPVSCSFSNNVVQTQSTANGQGYSSTQTYAFSPTLGGSTIGAGENLSSSWPGGYSTNDTTYACTDASNVVTCPARVSLTRGTTWDIGAYMYQSSGATTTITITGPLTITLGAGVTITP